MAKPPRNFGNGDIRGVAAPPGDWGLDFTFIPDAHGAYPWVRNRLFVGARVDEARSAAPSPRLTPAQVEAALLTASLERLPLPGDRLRPLGESR